MPAVLSLLLVGSLIIAPLLTHVGSGAKAAQIHEQRMAELYAADAGVENALWQIKTDATGQGVEIVAYTFKDTTGKVGLICYDTSVQ